MRTLTMGLPRIHLTRAGFLGLFVAAGAVAGCGGKGAAKPQEPAHQSGQFADLSKQTPEVMETKPAPGPAGQPDALWSIVIVSAMGEGMEADAKSALDLVRANGLPQAYMERRGKSIVVAYGRYGAPDAADAQADLKRIQGIELDKKKPFEAAVLVPPPFSSLPGSIPEYDLSTVRQRRGKSALYTLQVAAYARMDGNPASQQDLAEFRGAAEKAAVELRREGEEAFYHHGARMSVVTVGVFGEKDLDAAHPGKDSMLLTMARKRHPLNLVNGQGVKVRVRGQEEPQLQPSRVIVIPD
jgi:hypothetical protein